MLETSQTINSIMLLFIVLGFGAAAGYFCERVGIINIAIDGQMIFGALVFAIFGMILNQYLPNQSGLMFLVPLIIATFASILLSLLFGYLVIKLQANHVVVGTSINLILGGVATFLTRPLGSAISNGQIPKLEVTFLPEMPINGSGFFGETLIISIIAILILVFAMIYIYKSRFGLRFKAVGDNPNAVDAQGVNVNKYKWIAMIISGGFAAFAGSIFIYGGSSMYPQSSFFEGNVAGLGFLALAIVLAGIWRLPFITLAALAFAIITTVFNRTVAVDIAEALGTVHTVKLTQAIPFIISLLALIAFSWKGVAPKALGKHFNKSSR